MPTAIFVSGSNPNKEESEGQKEVVVLPVGEAMPKSFCFDECVAVTDNTSKQVESMDQMYDKQAQIRGQHYRVDDDDPQNNSTCCKHPGCSTENYICKGEYSRRHPPNASSTTPKWCAKVVCDTRTVSARKYLACARGYYMRHDPNFGKCKEKNCNNVSKVRGYCNRHNPTKGGKCKEKNCNNLPKVRGYCTRHAPNRKMCKEKNCDNLARARGYCYSHDPNNIKKCKEADCDTLVRGARGYCARHDPNNSKKCKEENCNNLPHAGGYCKSHYPNRKFCKVENCNNLPQARGYCRRHDPNRKMCKEENCNYLAQARGYCNRHDVPNRKMGCDVRNPIVIIE